LPERSGALLAVPRLGNVLMPALRAFHRGSRTIKRDTVRVASTMTSNKGMHPASAAERRIIGVLWAHRHARLRPSRDLAHCLNVYPRLGGAGMYSFSWQEIPGGPLFGCGWSAGSFPKVGA